MKPLFAVLLGPAILAGSLSPAWASDDHPAPEALAMEHSWYVAVRGGRTMTSMSDFVSRTPLPDDVGRTTRTTSSLANGFLAATAVGYKFGGGLRTEIDLSYRRNRFDGIFSSSGGIAVCIFDLPGCMKTTTEGHMSSWSVLANLYHDFDLGGRFKPYVGGGVGISRVTVDLVIPKERFAGMFSPTSDVPIFDQRDTVFTYNVMAGLGFDLVENVTVTAGYRFTGTGKTDSGFKLRSSETQELSGTHKLSSPNLHGIELGLRYSF